jgi:hypothetical protein
VLDQSWQVPYQRIEVRSCLCPLKVEQGVLVCLPLGDREFATFVLDGAPMKARRELSRGINYVDEAFFIRQSNVFAIR